jgi:hypothetical protein
MVDESKPVEVSRRIEAPVTRIFEILANPQRHMDFDGSCFGERSSTVPSPVLATPSP